MGGDEYYGGKIPDNIQIQNVKTIVSTDLAFAALFNNGSVLAWGFEFFGGKIPNKVRIQLKNVTMMFSTDVTFAALLNDGKVLTWGGRGNTKLIKNIKTIF